MRHFMLICAALALSACGQPHRTEGECALSATREITWPEGDAHFTATATSAGADCSSAALTLEVIGDHTVNVFTAPYADLVPSADGVTRAEVQRFLDSWVDITPLRASALPAWSESMSRPGEGVDALPYASPLSRAEYEALRARNLPTLCIARGAASVECLAADNDARVLRTVLGYGS